LLSTKYTSSPREEKTERRLQISKSLARKNRNTTTTEEIYTLDIQDKASNREKLPQKRTNNHKREGEQTMKRNIFTGGGGGRGGGREKKRKDTKQQSHKF
jgi:uncharacterized membrane protein YgcG